MNFATFEDVRNKLAQLEKGDNHDEKFAVLQQATSQFPERRRTISYWTMCLAARLNNPSLALNIFREALLRGDWFPASWLQYEDLQILQGLPEYEQLKSVSQQQKNAFQLAATPDLMIALPDNVTQSYPLLFALHRNSRTAAATIEHWKPITNHGWLLAVPQSSQVTGIDSYAWDDWVKAEKEIQDHYINIKKNYPVDAERVFMGGFSAGGGLAMWLAISGAITVRGFVVLAPYLRKKVDILRSFLDQAKLSGLRGYIIVGEQDMLCLDEAHQVSELLNAHEIPCQLEIQSNLQHDYPLDLSASLKKAQTFLCECF